MAGDGWTGYRRVSSAYARGRAPYPDSAVDRLLANLGVPAAGRVADLGAGTGIFSTQLAVRGLSVDAVEPVEAMRSRIPSDPPIGIHDGRAEATGLPAGSYDAVFAATAWHWFDPQRAADEVRRLLKPGAGLGLIWTGYDETVPWVRALADISARRRPADSPSATSGVWRDRFGSLPGWTTLQREEIRTTRSTTPDALVQRLRSSSVIAALDTRGRHAAEEELRAVLLDDDVVHDGTVDVPYSTETYWTFPR